MQNFISSSDLLCWNIILKGNSAKSMITDNDGNLKIRPPVTAEEHQQVQREKKDRTILLSALPDEHMEEGLDKGYDKMQKILTQMNTLKIKPKQEDVNMKFLRGLPLSWSGIALILKTKRGLEYISFDDLYKKLKFLEIDTKGIHQILPPFLMLLLECQAQGGQNSNNYQKYKSKEAGKDGSNSKAMVFVDGSIDWDKQTDEGNTEPRSLENLGMIAGIKIESDANSEGEVVSADNTVPACKTRMKIPSNLNFYKY
nr:hypothetical protein [Tanacetum cinerariifolium]